MIPIGIRSVYSINLQRTMCNVFQTHEKRFEIQILPDTDWKTTLTDQKCPINDGSSEVEQMPAIQPLSATDIGIKLSPSGRGK